MKKSEFEKLLIEAELSNREFAEKVGMNPNSITNWKTAGKIPEWVKSWLDMYIKLKTGTIKNEKVENNDYEDFILNTAVSKIINAFDNRKVDDHYILEIIASSIENSKDEHEIENKILKYLSENQEEAMKIRKVLLIMSDIEKEILIKKKEKVVKKFEEYIRTVDNLSSLYTFDTYIDFESIPRIDQSLVGK